MNQITKTWIAAIAFGLVSLCSFSQDLQELRSPRWVSDKGYWVVESNINHQLDHIVRFYNNDDVLIYSETVSGVRLNLAKRKVKVKLKKALEASLSAFEEKKVPDANRNYITAMLR